MKKSLLLVSAVTVAAAVHFFAAIEVQAAGTARPRPPATSTNNETYMVVKIDSEYRVIATSRFKDEEKRIKDEYEQKLKEWQDARKTEPDAPRPPKPVVKVLMRGYKTEKMANEYRDKLAAEDEANKEGKGEDPRIGPPAPSPIRR